MMRTRTLVKWFSQAAFTVACAFASQAATAQSISVGAVILSGHNCQFRAGSATTLPFGSIDPSSLTNATATAVMVVRCNGGGAIATFNITSNDGLYSTGPGAPRMRHTVDTSRFLPYSVNVPYSASIPRNTNTNITLTGTVTVANFQDAIAGNYNDTLTLTINP